MKHDSIPCDLLRLDPQALFSSWSSADNVSDHLEIALALGLERKPLHRIPKEYVPGLRRRIGIPVMRVLGTPDNRAAVQRTRDTKGPASVGVLAG